jgi:hypothetical protein
VRRLALTALVLAGLAVAAPASAAPRVTDLGVAFAGRLGSSTTAARPLGDRIVVGLGSGGLVVLDPRRRFARTQRVGGLATTALAVADLDGDGRRDVIAAGLGGQDFDEPRLAVHYGRADGTLGAERILPFPTGQSRGYVISAVRVADLDGDGRQDLVTALRRPLSAETPAISGRGVSVIRATGRRRFAVVDRPTTLEEVSSILVADVTGDGRRDLIADGRRLRGRGDGRFGPPDGHPGPPVNDTLLVDLIGDRRRDLVLVDRDGAFVRRGTREGFAAERTAMGTAVGDSRNHAYGDAALVDLDGDDRRELVVPGRTSVGVLRGGRRRALGSEVTFALPAGEADRAIVVIDVDGDGRRDLVSVRSDGQDGRIDVLRNRGLRRRSRPRLIGSPVAVPAAGAGLLRFACSRGVGHCTGDVVLRNAAGRKVADDYIDIRPGQVGRDTVRFRGGRIPKGRLRITVAGTDEAPKIIRRSVAAPRPADLRAFCRAAGYVVARGASGVVITASLTSDAATCEFADGRVTGIDLEYADGPFAIRGAYVAGVGRSCGDGPEGCVVEVLVTSLRRRKTITRVVTTPVADCDTANGGDCGDRGVSGLVVGRSGSVAWITCEGSFAEECGPATVRTVHMALAGGKRVEVAASRHIRARSLGLATDGRSFSYEDDAGAHSVAFPTT